MKSIIKRVLILFISITILLPYSFKNYNYSFLYNEDKITLNNSQQPKKAMYVFNPINWGGGGLVNQDMPGYSNSGGGGGGGVALVVTYSFINLCISIFQSAAGVLQNDSTSTLDDYLDNENVKNLINENGWTKVLLIEWLTIMLGVAIEEFLNDQDDIIVYLGSTSYEVKYYESRDIEKHQYAFHTDDKTWGNLVDKVCNGNYKMVWVLNAIFLELCIMKNVTFCLVTPTYKYYDYPNKKVIENEKGRVAFYSQELFYINSQGYEWQKYFDKNVMTKRV